MNPYKTLGIKSNASDDEVREAYREMAKKYHPDKYRDNPLGDLASEKMKEINEAYDTIKKQRSGSGSRQSDYDTNDYGGSTNSNATGIYAQIRNYIGSGNLSEAEQLLSEISTRDAEWNYLSGCVALRRGAYNQAYSYFQIATSMNPQNMEYREAFARMSNQANQYRNRGSPMGNASCCNCCSNLICADCCCECMGGDLISCC